MSTKIGLFSDPHAAPGPVAEALSIFLRQGVERVLCGGDIAGYGDELQATIELLRATECECVVGNHDLWYVEHHRGEVPSLDGFLERLPSHIEFNLEGRSIYLVHANPPDSNRGGIKLRNKQGLIEPKALAVWSQRLRNYRYDLLLVGHTHQLFAQRFGSTLVVNPGSCRYNHSCAVITLPQMDIAWFSLSGEVITPVWNWGINEIRQSEIDS